MSALLDDSTSDRLDQHERPDEVEQLEEAEEDQEEVVEGGELKVVARIKNRWVEDPGRKYTTSCDDPSNSKEAEKDVTAVLEAGVLQKFGKLQQVVGAVVHQNYQGAHPGEVSCPGEGDEGDGGVVVDEHLPEVLALHVKELAD